MVHIYHKRPWLVVFKRYGANPVISESAPSTVGATYTTPQPRPRRCSPRPTRRASRLLDPCNPTHLRWHETTPDYTQIILCIHHEQLPTPPASPGAADAPYLPPIPTYQLGVGSRVRENLVAAAYNDWQRSLIIPALRCRRRQHILRTVVVLVLDEL